MRVDVLARCPFFADDHQAYRDAVRTFIERHVEPFVETWEEDRLVPREPWLEAGRQGFLGLSVPEEYGGAGVRDYRFQCAMTEEFARIGAMSVLNGFTRAYRDTRVTTIYGGTTEIMKLIIGREIVGRP
ncbi:MAG: hypothetical protein QOC83_841 [Pseudonocardiales bacterium]|nr:hypothetical protein [Pseudonocardiales bacterium]